MTFDEIAGVVMDISHPTIDFKLTQEPGAGHLTLQGVFVGKCSKTGKMEKWTTRKWRLSYHMTKSEIVQTALKCVLTAVEHEAREQFTYKDKAIFGPHFDVDKLVELCGTPGCEDTRK